MGARGGHMGDFVSEKGAGCDPDHCEAGLAGLYPQTWIDIARKIEWRGCKDLRVTATAYRKILKRPGDWCCWVRPAWARARRPTF